MGPAKAFEALLALGAGTCKVLGSQEQESCLTVTKGLRAPLPFFQLRRSCLTSSNNDSIPLAVYDQRHLLILISRLLAEESPSFHDYITCKLLQYPSVDEHCPPNEPSITPKTRSVHRATRQLPPMPKMLSNFDICTEALYGIANFNHAAIEQ